MSRVVFTGVVALSLVVLFSPGPNVPSGVPISDKVIHFLLFAALAATGRLAGMTTLRLAVGLVAYAGVSEILQTVLPIHRDGDIRDALADTLGVLTGLAVLAAARRRSH
ncbi:MAG: VanZ family protein [Marmoricola sp.]